MTLFTHETNKRRNTMLEEILVENNARDLIDALREMVNTEDVRNSVRYSHGAEVVTCECCGGTGVEGIEREPLDYYKQKGWTNPPCLCISCEGQGNFITYDQRNPQIAGDAGWD